MHRCLLISMAVLMAMSSSSLAADPDTEKAPARIDLVGRDYPEYVETIGALSLPSVSAEHLATTDPQYLRLSLVDVEEVPYLSSGFVIYQTVSTGTEIPVNVNFIVDEDENAWCFNPEIPYCSDFPQINKWLRKAGHKVSTRQEAGSLARYVLALGMSTAHHPRDFLFLRISGKFGVEHHEFLKNIEDIYEESRAKFRSEREQEEVASILRSYGERVKPPTTVKHGKGWHFHAFTYKMMKDGGDLREWDIELHPDGTVEVKMTPLEQGIGEVTWSWAQ